MDIPNGKKIYFASDAHFGLTLFENPIDSQKRFVRWMDAIKSSCGALFLVGDMFDYWFEYNHVVPKGYTRFLGKLSEFSDAGIPVFVFTGNHDVWMYDYLPAECGVTVIKDSWQGSLLGQQFYIAHGDGLGDPSWGFRILRAIFHSKILQFFYKWIHPDVTIPFGLAWSHFNRKRRSGTPQESYLGESGEYLLSWAKQQHAINPSVNFYIFGHRHIQLDFSLPTSTSSGTQDPSRVIVLGDWFRQYTYAVFDGQSLSLLNFKD